jgi:amidophosphoribosyltransferase
MCGIVGIVNAASNIHVTQALVDALTLLQHRGQDATGIVTSHKNRLHMRKDNGTVAEVFTQENIGNLRGHIGIAHVRYPTAGGLLLVSLLYYCVISSCLGRCSAEAQPFYTNYPFGIALAHNGNLTNALDLLEGMKQAHRHINTDSDSEVLLNIFADELQRRQLSHLQPDDIFDALRIVLRKCVGGYSVVLLINGIGLLAFRDPHGIRPLCFGKRSSTTLSSSASFSSDGSSSQNHLSPVYDYIVASESVAIEALTPPFRLERDIRPGEAVFIGINGQLVTRAVYNSSSIPFAPCLFEYVYFARPDSVRDLFSLLHLFPFTVSLSLFSFLFVPRYLMV